MKKLLFALAVLALAILLTPMQEARADWHKGDSCLGCGKEDVGVGWWGNDTHMVFCGTCDYFEMMLGDGTMGLIESHYGGTATCTSGPICEGCKEEYGSPDPDAHNWDMDHWTSDGTSHWHACKNAGCTARKDEADHSGGTATLPDESQMRGLRSGIRCACRSRLGRVDPKRRRARPRVQKFRHGLQRG